MVFNSAKASNYARPEAAVFSEKFAQMYAYIFKQLGVNHLEVKIVGERLGLPSRACHRARAEELTAEAASAFSGQPKERWLGGGGEDMGRHQVLSLF